MQRVFDCICRFVVSFLLRFGQRICEGQRPYAVTKANTKLCALNNIIINSQFFFCSFIEFAPFLFVIAPQVHHCHWGYCHDLIDARSQIAIQLIHFAKSNFTITKTRFTIWCIRFVYCRWFHIFFLLYRDLELMTESLCILYSFCRFIFLFLWLFMIS